MKGNGGKWKMGTPQLPHTTLGRCYLHPYEYGV